MASKRQRSPSPMGSSRSAHPVHDVFSYQELFLRILSHLSPTELVVAQGVNRYWAQMTLDQQLWKRLYLSKYPHPHHSRLIYKPPSSGSSTPSRLRPIARLPSRAFPPPSPSRSPSLSRTGPPTPSRAPSERKTSGIGHALPLHDRDMAQEVGFGIRHDGVDWKMMMRLGTNWSNGNVLSHTSVILPPSPSPSASSLSAQEQEAEPIASPPPYTEQHIALTPSFIFTSNPNSPLVHVHRSASSSESTPLGIIPPPPKWSSPTRPDNITAICADQRATPTETEDEAAQRGALPARLAVFYQSGGFVILAVSLQGSRLHWTRESVHPAQSRPRSIRRRAITFSPLEGDPVVLATMHHPVLITCTLAFHLSVYVIPQSTHSEPSRPKHLSTMHSDVSFHPAALSLLPSAEVDGKDEPPDNSFRAALTYCTPLYPSSWTVAVQELGIELDKYGGGDVSRGECINVGKGDEDDEAERIWPRKLRPVVGVKGRHAVGVGTDGRWCVLAGQDNQIQVFSLPTPSPSPPPSRPSPIVHSQTLLAHSSAVTSISLNAGRCVSGGRDGRVLVWELDHAEDDAEGKVGRTIGYVEVRQGGRRWRGPSGPQEIDITTEEREELWRNLPHPASISTAARSLFLPQPPGAVDDRPPAIRQLAFDEEKIVGLVRVEPEAGGDGTPSKPVAEIMKVWSFNA